jgi:2'-hydroxyisoflavone reductase
MRILILGGTGFLGRHIVEAAIAAGHEPTLFNRGRTDPKAFAQWESLRGDRSVSLAALRGRSWDAVIDTCGTQPADVAASLALLRDNVQGYVYISSVMAYRDWGRRGQNEKSPLYPEAPDASTETSAYRARRAACDRIVRQALPRRSLVVRPGLLVGPRDPAEILAYWSLRARRDGEALAPGNPDRLVQLLDVRDLARWLVAATARRRGGVFNAFGPSVTMKTVIKACAAASKGSASFTWVDDEFLLVRLGPRRDISARPLQFLELLPGWIPGLDDRFSSAAARRAGFVTRPLAQTARDAFAGYNAGSRLRRPFMDAQQEAALLAQWRRETHRKSR